MHFDLEVYLLNVVVWLVFDGWSVFCHDLAFQNLLDVQESNVFGVLLNKRAAGLYVFAH